MAVLQYIFNSNTAKNEADKQRKIEAANMANEFRQNVIPLINKLSIAYCDDILYKEIIDYLDKSKLIYFNKDEVDRLFPNDKYIQYRVLIAKNYLIQTNKEAKELFEKYEKDKNLTVKERQELNKQLKELLSDSYSVVSSMCNDLSNSLEYMCICFNTNIADDETVYQSLHNVFFTAVHLIYIFTFDINTNEHDRLFYNIMVLYKKWKILNIKKKQEEENNKAKFEEDVNKLKAQYDSLITIKTQCK